MDLECCAAEVFLDCSAKHKSKKPNSDVLRFLLEADVADWVQWREWDFSRNLLGKCSLRAVLELSLLNSGMQHISFANNKLDTEDVKCILEAMEKHKLVQTIDMSNSPMSVVSARAIHAFVQRCANITQFNLEGTGIDTGEWMPRIERELKLNRQRQKQTVALPRAPNQWLVRTVVFAAMPNVDSSITNSVQNALAQLNAFGMEQCRAAALLARWDLTNSSTGEAMIVLVAPGDTIDSAFLTYIEHRARLNPSSAVLVYTPVSAQNELTTVLMPLQSVNPLSTVFFYHDVDHLVLRLQSDIWRHVFDQLGVAPEQNTTLSVMTRRLVSHQAYMRSHGVSDRQKDITDIVKYSLNTGVITVPLVVFGESGLGASTLLATAGKKLSVEPNVRVVPYFMRSSSDTTTVASFVFDILHGLLGAAAAGELLSRTSDADLTTLLYETLLNWGTSAITTVLLVGGWDLVAPVRTDIHRYIITSWLPDVLPANLRVVVSFNTADRSLQLLRSRKPLPLELRIGALSPHQQLSNLQHKFDEFHLEFPAALQQALEDPHHFKEKDGVVDTPTSLARAFVAKQDSHLPMYSSLVAAACVLLAENRVPNDVIDESYENNDDNVDSDTTVESFFLRCPGSVHGMVARLLHITSHMFGEDITRTVVGAICSCDGNDPTVFELTSVVHNVTQKSHDEIGSLVGHLKWCGLVDYTLEGCVHWKHVLFRDAALVHLQWSEDESDDIVMAFAVYYRNVLRGRHVQTNALVRALIRTPHALIHGRQVDQALEHVSDLAMLQQTIDRGQLWSFLNVVWCLALEFAYLKEIGLETLTAHQFCRNHKTERLHVMFNSLIHSCVEITAGTSLMQLCLQMPRASLLGKAVLEQLQPTRKANVNATLLDWVNRSLEDRVSSFTWQLGDTARHCDISKDGVLVVATTPFEAFVFTTIASEGEGVHVCSLHINATELGSEMLGTHFIPDGGNTPTRAVTFSSTALIVWNCQTGQVVRNLDGYTLSLRSQCISSSGKRLVAANVSEGSTAAVIDLDELKVVSELPPMGDDDAIREVHFAVYIDTVMAVATYEVQVHKPNDSGPVISMQHDQLINHACISNDAVFVATACRSIIFLWRTSTGVLLYRMNQHTVDVNDVVFHPSGQILISSSHDGAINVWSATNGEVVREFTAGTRRGSDMPLNPNFVTYTSDGMRVVARCDDVLRIWDSTSWTDLGVCHGHMNNIVFVSMCGKYYVSSDAGGTVKVWSSVSSLTTLMAYQERHFVTTDDVMLHSTAHRDAIGKIAITEAGFMATLGDDRRLHLWSMSSKGRSPCGSRSRTPTPSPTKVNSPDKTGFSRTSSEHPVIVESVDGIYASSGADPSVLYVTHPDSTISVYDGISSQPLRTLELVNKRRLHTVDAIHHVTHYDKKLIAFVLHSNDGPSNRIVVYDLETTELVTQMCGHTQDITGLHFITSDTLISTSNDCTVRLWGIDVNNQVSEHPVMEPVSALAVKHGRILVSYSSKQRVQCLTFISAHQQQTGSVSSVNITPSSSTPPPIAANNSGTYSCASSHQPNTRQIEFGCSIDLPNAQRRGSPLLLSRRSTTEGTSPIVGGGITAIEIAHAWLALAISDVDGAVHLIQLDDKNDQVLLRYVSAIRPPYGLPTSLSSGMDDRGTVWVAIGDSHGHCFLYNTRCVVERQPQSKTPSRASLALSPLLQVEGEKGTR
eukprot:PhM_4_TR10062/c0_g1_i1/m.88380